MSKERRESSQEIGEQEGEKNMVNNGQEIAKPNYEERKREPLEEKFTCGRVLNYARSCT